MRNKILNINFSKLLKLEVQKMANDAIRIVEKYNPEELQIKPMFDLLVAEQPKIDGLRVKFRGHPLTKKLKPLRKKRDVFVSAIKFEQRKVARLDTSGDDDAVLLVGSEITRFLDDFYNSENEIVKHQKIVQFIDEVESNVPLSAAMSELGFMDILESLETTLSEIVAILSERIDSISKRPKEKTDDLRRSVVTAVKNMFKEINLAQLKNPELDYTELIDELNEMIKGFVKQINLRIAYNARKAAEKAGAGSYLFLTDAVPTKMQIETAGNEGASKGSEVDMASIGKRNSSMMMEYGNGNGNESDGDSTRQGVEQKKAAAKDWTPMQQPRIVKESSDN